MRRAFVGRVTRGLSACLPLVLACNNPPDAPNVQPTSQPVVPASGGVPIVISSARPGVATWTTASTNGQVVWLSAPSRAIPNGYQVTIRGSTSGLEARVFLQDDGGFDPLPFPVQPGETLHAEVETIQPQTGQMSIATYALSVPATSHPIVLRTSPVAHAINVALNASVSVTFSEPVAAASLNDSAIQLVGGGGSVASRLAFADSQHATVTLTPSAPLVATTQYAIGVTQAVRTLDGVALSPALADFTTGTSILEQPVGQLAYSAITANGTSQIFLMNADGSNVRQLTYGIESRGEPAWSPDGTRIAFSTSWIVNNVLYSRIAVIDADGSNEIALVSDASDPAWSPDGRRVAFVQNADQIYSSEGFLEQLSRIGVVNADGSGRAWLTNGDPGPFSDANPQWSPDGGRIAFNRTSLVDAKNDSWTSSIDVIRAGDAAPETVRVPDTGGCTYGAPDWLDAGSLLFWDSCRSGLVIGDANGSGATRDIASSIPAFAAPRVSPDGRWITFALASNPYAQPAVYLMLAQGSELRRIGTGFGVAWRPRR